MNIVVQSLAKFVDFAWLLLGYHWQGIQVVNALTISYNLAYLAVI